MTAYRVFIGNVTCICLHTFKIHNQDDGKLYDQTQLVSCRAF